MVFGYVALRQVLWLSAHSLCALGRRQTLAIIISQFSVCYGVKCMLFQLFNMIFPYRQFDCASAIAEKGISHHSSIFFSSNFRPAPFNHSTYCKDTRCQACEQRVNLCYLVCWWRKGKVNIMWRCIKDCTAVIEEKSSSALL